MEDEHPLSNCYHPSSNNYISFESEGGGDDNHFFLTPFIQTTIQESYSSISRRFKPQRPPQHRQQAFEQLSSMSARMKSTASSIDSRNNNARSLSGDPASSSDGSVGAGVGRGSGSGRWYSATGTGNVPLQLDDDNHVTHNQTLRLRELLPARRHVSTETTQSSGDTKAQDDSGVEDNEEVDDSSQESDRYSYSEENAVYQQLIQEQGDQLKVKSINLSWRRPYALFRTQTQEVHPRSAVVAASTTHDWAYYFNPGRYLAWLFNVAVRWLFIVLANTCCMISNTISLGAYLLLLPWRLLHKAFRSLRLRGGLSVLWMSAVLLGLTMLYTALSVGHSFWAVRGLGVLRSEVPLALSRYYQRYCLRSRIRFPEEPIYSIADLGSRINWIQRSIQDLGDADEQLRWEIALKCNTMDQRTSGMEAQLKRVGGDLDALKNYFKSRGWIENVLLERLKLELPQWAALAQDPTMGKVRVPLAFWNCVRELFTVYEEQDTDTPNGSWVPLDRKDSTTQGMKKTWIEFLNENERALHQLMNERVTMMSRDDFLQMFKSEATDIWESLQATISRFLDQKNQFATDGQKQKSMGGDGGDKKPLLKSLPRCWLSDMETHAVQNLIDIAVKKYSADVIAKPDYALLSTGARIIPDLTSNDFKAPEKPTLLGRLGLKYIFRRSGTSSSVVSSPSLSIIRGAAEAIQPDMHVGRCWAMNGTQGQIGIRLSRAIVVTEVTVEHVDPRVALDYTSAPREIEIWRLIAPTEAKQRFPTSDMRSFPDKPSQSRDPSVLRQPKETSSPIKGTWWKQGSPFPGASLLATIEYNVPTRQQHQEDDIHRRHGQQQFDTLQTFPIPLSKQNVPATGVVVRIKSNWGRPEFTCLYRVRVHGYERAS